MVALLGTLLRWCWTMSLIHQPSVSECICINSHVYSEFKWAASLDADFQQQSHQMGWNQTHSFRVRYGIIFSVQFVPTDSLRRLEKEAAYSRSLKTHTRLKGEKKNLQWTHCSKYRHSPVPRDRCKAVCLILLETERWQIAWNGFA